MRTRSALLREQREIEVAYILADMFSHTATLAADKIAALVLLTLSARTFCE